jgi:arylsulfatase
MKIKNIVLAASSLFSLFSVMSFAQEIPHPNVIILITDDQGYGDLGITGNSHLQTPVIDEFAIESVRFDNFYVASVCAPTRSSLMTERYSLRTGIRDTYNGGAMMASNEVITAKMLKLAFNKKTQYIRQWELK